MATRPPAPGPRRAGERDPRRVTQLFISHITEEKEVALALQAMLQQAFPGEVEVFTSSDSKSILAGDDWLDCLHDALEQASAIVVLCSKASVQRSWVQFEMGAGWMKDLTIIPVCHSRMNVADLPSPLSRWNGVQLTMDGLVKLVNSVAVEARSTRVPDPAALRPHLAALNQAERNFQSGPLVQFELAMDILLPAPGTLDGPVIPPEAVVELNDESLRIFDYLAGPLSWQQVEDAATRVRDRRWLVELQHVVYLASRGNAFRPVQAVYHTPRASYQPQLAKREVLRDGTTRFHVHFVETVVAPLVEADNQFALMATLLRLGLRFRYEVIDKIDHQLRLAEITPGTDDDAVIAQLLAFSRSAIERIESDALSRGAPGFDRVAVIDLFATLDDQREMTAVQREWDKSRADLFRVSPAPDLTSVRAAIDAMRALNGRFMRLGARRFHELVEKQW